MKVDTDAGQMDRAEKNAFSWPVATALTAFAILIAVVSISPPVLLYDERYYMESAYFLAEDSDFWTLMTTPLDLAAGPVYPYLHVALASLTDLRPPGIRYVNVACLLITIAACAIALRRLDYDRPMARAAMLLAVPMIGPTSGLALTELPSLALASLSMVAVAEAVFQRRPAIVWMLWTVAGIAAGFAVMARQTYLPGLIGFVLVGIGVPRHLPAALFATLLALAVVAPLVWAWGGLTPPWQVASMTTIEPRHGILAFIYLATAIALIAPRFFLPPVRTRPFALVMIAAALLIFTAALFAKLHFPIADRVIAAAPPALQSTTKLALNAAMLGIAASFIVAVLAHLWQRRTDLCFLLFGGLTVLLNGTAAGIGHQFSSRYVLVAFPFALMMVQPWIGLGHWAGARIALGASLGFASLSAYYWNPPPADSGFRFSAPAEILAKMPLTEREKAAR